MCGLCFSFAPNVAKSIRHIYEGITTDIRLSRYLDSPSKPKRYLDMTDKELENKLSLLSTEELAHLVRHARSLNAANHARRLAELALKDTLNHSLNRAPNIPLKK